MGEKYRSPSRRVLVDRENRTYVRSGYQARREAGIVNIKNRGAGIPDLGLFLDRPVTPSRKPEPWSERVPERGVVEGRRSPAPGNRMKRMEDVVSEREEQGGDPEIGTCHICGHEFGTQEELSKHLMDVHRDDALGEEIE